MEFTLPAIKRDYQTDLAKTHQFCELLIKTPHYAKIGTEGIFAIVETAKSLGVDPRQALGGGLYYVKGKVEMSSRMMNALIRSQKHSIVRDEKSDESICILHGKRADNGDTWTESFSIQDAQRAGLMGNAVWKNYPKDMLFARALSRLARQLFPDVIGNCYVEGEILPPQETEEKSVFSVPEIECISDENETLDDNQLNYLLPLIKVLDTDSKKNFINWLNRTFNVNAVEDVPKSGFEKCKTSVEAKIKYINDLNKQNQQAAVA